MSEMRQLNIRIPLELAAALQAHVDGTGEKQSAVVRRGIEIAIGQRAEAETPSSTSPAAELQEEMNALRVAKRENAAHALEAFKSAVAQPGPPARSSSAVPGEDREGGDTGSSSSQVDFAAWIANRAGVPKAIARRRISEGRVEVDGRARHCDTIDQKELQRVTLDGEPL